MRKAVENVIEKAWKACRNGYLGLTMLMKTYGGRKNTENRWTTFSGVTEKADEENLGACQGRASFLLKGNRVWRRCRENRVGVFLCMKVSNGMNEKGEGAFALETICGKVVKGIQNVRKVLVLPFGVRGVRGRLGGSILYGNEIIRSIWITRKGISMADVNGRRVVRGSRQAKGVVRILGTTGDYIKRRSSRV